MTQGIRRHRRAFGPLVNTPVRKPLNVVDRGLFTFLLHRELHKATRLGYSVSVLSLAPDPPPRRPRRALLNRLAALSIGQLRATDLAAAFPPSAVAILLVDAETRNVPGIFERLKEGLPSIRGVTLSAGGGCYPQTASSGNELLQQALDLAARANADGGNRLYLPP